MIFKGSQAAESDIVKVTEGNARFLSFELGRKTSILLGVLIVVVSFLCTAQAQTEEKTGKKTVTLPNGEVILDISGEWDGFIQFCGT